MDQTAHNLQQQIELYGEPLGETVRRVLGPLGLTQGGLAQLIGMSAPMLSQLVSAQRVKIGNPAVMSRLRAASELADLAITSEIGDHEIPAELDRIRQTTGGLTTSGSTGHPPRSGQLPDGLGTVSSGIAGQVPGGAGADVASGIHTAWPAGVGVRVDDGATARAVVRAIQDLLREVASADEIQQAAAALEAESPALAELLLAYGTGRTADALAHYEQHHG
ncbi:DNA-binding protein [Kribbella sp. NPDC058693]|uniref:DNA-binding protein n=1 Tax=Kribbella jiaozuonensis TaxID=2575441 RepID=A0A4U3LHQ7_9ACTN|nr:DNA-binding protein [Kribbella jiaozuonensis]TKK75128.1 DNA-binding protein [Kribbella jiaozuonensis]